jgi:hypothetical protein
VGGRLTGVRDEYQAILEGQEKNSGNSGIELVSGSDLQAVIADCDRMPRSGVLEQPRSHPGSLALLVCGFAPIND